MGVVFRRVVEICCVIVAFHARVLLRGMGKRAGWEGIDWLLQEEEDINRSESDLYSGKRHGCFDECSKR